MHEPEDRISTDLSGTMLQVVELLPHSARDPGSVLTAGAVCVNFTHSSCGHVGFSHIPRTCGFVVLFKLISAKSLPNV